MTDLDADVPASPATGVGGPHALPGGPAGPVSRDWAREQRKGSGTPLVPTGIGRRGALVYSFATLVFVAGLVALAWQGYRTTLDIKGGTSLDAETNPSKPGYEAQVKPIPTHLLVNVDAAGALTEVQLLVPSATAAGGGVVLFIPGVTLVETPEGNSELVTYAAANGIDATVSRIEELLGFGLTDAVTLNPDQAAAMFEPLGSFTIDNPDALVSTGVDGNKQIEFGAGSQMLAPTDVARYLAFVSDGDTGINRSARNQIVWKQWMAALAANPAAVPTVPPLEPAVGDNPVDLAAIVSGLSSGQVVYRDLPTTAISLPGAEGAKVYRVDAAAMAALVPEIVPYPTSATPGQRVRVRVLNGTSDLGAATRAASTVVGAGGEIIVVGNAKPMDATVTTVEFHSEAMAERAAPIAAAFGVTATASSLQTDAIDVTVTLGPDSP